MTVERMMIEKLMMTEELMMIEDQVEMKEDQLMIEEIMMIEDTIGRRTMMTIMITEVKNVNVKTSHTKMNQLPNLLDLFMIVLMQNQHQFMTDQMLMPMQSQHQFLTGQILMAIRNQLQSMIALFQKQTKSPQVPSLTALELLPKLHVQFH